MHPTRFFFLSHLIFSKDIRLDKGLNWADPSPRVYNIYIYIKKTSKQSHFDQKIIFSKENVNGLLSMFCQID